MGVKVSATEKFICDAPGCDKYLKVTTRGPHLLIERLEDGWFSRKARRHGWFVDDGAAGLLVLCPSCLRAFYSVMEQSEELEVTK
jgi:hypothetical protein